MSILFYYKILLHDSLLVIRNINKYYFNLSNMNKKFMFSIALLMSIVLGSGFTVANQTAMAAVITYPNTNTLYDNAYSSSDDKYSSNYGESEYDYDYYPSYNNNDKTTTIPIQMMTNIHPITANLSMIMPTITTTTITKILIQIMTNIQTPIVNLAIHITITTTTTTTTTIKIPMTVMRALIINIQTPIVILMDIVNIQQTTNYMNAKKDH